MTTGNTTPDREAVHPHDGQVSGVTVWSPQKAASECQVGRSTIMRKLYAGEIPGAEKVDGAWQIPVPGLIAAGLKPGRPAPPVDPADEGDHAVQRGVHGTVRTGSRVSTGESYAYLREIAELKAQIEVEKARVEVEVARRVAAEQLAEERRGRITDLQQALRMLTPAPQPTENTGKTISETADSSSEAPMVDPIPATPTTPEHDTEPVPQEAISSPEPTPHDGSPAQTKPESRGVFSRLRHWLT